MYALFITFLILLLLALPIAFVLGGASLIFVLSENIPITAIPQRFFTGVDTFIFLSIPFFILAGNLMNEAGMTERLVRFARYVIGGIPASLAQVNVVVSMFFGGITGAAVADVAAVGSVLIPAMNEDNYDPDYSAALTAASSLLGPIIPPSIPMIVFAVSSGASIAALFLAGVIPGAIIGISMMILNLFLLRKSKLHQHKIKRNFKEGLLLTRDALLSIVMPMIIILGIVFGAFTATEASAVAVFYSFFIGVFIYRTIKISRIPTLLKDAAITSAAVLIIVAAATAFGWMLSYAGIPQIITNAFLSTTSSPIVFLILTVILLLIIGCFLEPSGAIIILTPVLLPAAQSYGIGVIHFGAVMVLGLVIGLLTPPVGLCLYVVSSVSNRPVEKIIKWVMPFIALLIVILLAVVFVPALTTWLPNKLL